MLRFTAGLYGQSTLIPSDNMAFVRSKMELRPVSGICAGGDGDSVVWNFSNMSVVDDEKELRIAADSTSFSIKEKGRYRYFKVIGDSVFLTSYRTHLEEVSYAGGMLAKRFPLHYGDSIARPFVGRGKYCGKYDITQEGTSVVKADARGSILLPGGLSLPNVLRVHSLRSMRIGLSGIQPRDGSDPKLAIEDRYEWFANGSLYPVFTSTTSTVYSGGRQVSSLTEAYCCLTDSVLAHAKASQKGASDEDDGSNQAKESCPMTQQILTMNGQTLSLDFTMATQATVEFAITDTYGIMYHQRSGKYESGEHTVRFDCGGYRPGNYILYINVSGIVLSEKFHI